MFLVHMEDNMISRSGLTGLHSRQSWSVEKIVLSLLYKNKNNFHPLQQFLVIMWSAHGTHWFSVQWEFFKCIQARGMEHMWTRQQNSGARLVLLFVESLGCKWHDTYWTIRHTTLYSLKKKKKTFQIGYTSSMTNIEQIQGSPTEIGGKSLPAETSHCFGTHLKLNLLPVCFFYEFLSVFIKLPEKKKTVKIMRLLLA